MPMSSKSPSVRILKLLKDAKAPVNHIILRRYISRKYSDEQIASSLIRLFKLGYITKVGEHTHYIYSITSKGLDRLFILENKLIANEVSDLVLNYLIKIGGAD